MIMHPFPMDDVKAYTPPPAIYRSASVAERNLLPYFGGSGTGGIEGVEFTVSRRGYQPFRILEVEPTAPQEAYASVMDLLKAVNAGFGRTMSHLPAVFGVSRQTLYNWRAGSKTPKEHHRSKLVQLAAAARAFTNARFEPTALSLDRTVAQGKSFIELIGQGADGKETAELLIKIAQRGAVAQKELDAILGDRATSRLDVADMGRPALNENV